METIEQFNHLKKKNKFKDLLKQMTHTGKQVCFDVILHIVCYLSLNLFSLYYIVYGYVI